MMSPQRVRKDHETGNFGHFSKHNLGKKERQQQHTQCTPGGYNPNHKFHGLFHLYDASHCQVISKKVTDDFDISTPYFYKFNFH